METKKRWIYLLIDPRDNSKKYVGMSKDPNKRLKDHIYDSKRERTKKGNWIRKLVNNGLKPILVILEETDVENCAYWEEYHIKKLIGEGNVLLNYDDKGVGTCGKFNKENLEKIKKNRGNKIIMYDLNGIQIKEFESLREASRITGINHGNISKCCSGKFKHTGGFIFKKIGYSGQVNKVTNPNAIKKIVLELDADGEIINTWKSISEASKETKIDSSKISRICNNKIKIKNRYFKFKKDE